MKEGKKEILTKRKKMFHVNTGTQDSASKEAAPIFTPKRTVKLTYLAKCVEKNHAKKGTEKHVGIGTKVDVSEKKNALTSTKRPGNPEIKIEE